jgi:hypothetical protein
VSGWLGLVGWLGLLVWVVSPWVRFALLPGLMPSRRVPVLWVGALWVVV